MSAPDNNSLRWRVDRLEYEVRELQQGKPAVIAERVETLSNRVRELRIDINEDIAALREQVKTGDNAQAAQIASFRRIFVGTFTGVGVVIAGAVIALIISGGAP